MQPLHFAVACQAGLRLPKQLDFFHEVQADRHVPQHHGHHLGRRVLMLLGKGDKARRTVCALDGDYRLQRDAKRLTKDLDRTP